VVLALVAGTADLAGRPGRRLGGSRVAEVAASMGVVRVSLAARDPAAAREPRGAALATGAAGTVVDGSVAGSTLAAPLARDFLTYSESVQIVKTTN